MTREGILLQHALHQPRQTIEAFPHVGDTQSQVNLHPPTAASSLAASLEQRHQSAHRLRIDIALEPYPATAHQLDLDAW